MSYIVTNAEIPKDCDHCTLLVCTAMTYERGSRPADCPLEEVKEGEWIVRHRHEHYPSGKPYDENVCPFCGRADHNGDGVYCGYCGAKMNGKDEIKCLS